MTRLVEFPLDEIDGEQGTINIDPNLIVMVREAGSECCIMHTGGHGTFRLKVSRQTVLDAMKEAQSLRR